MVALNDYLPLNHIQLRNNLCKEIDTFMEKEFYHFLEENIIKKIQKKTNKKIKELFLHDHFLYMNIHSNFCTHKIKKGKRDGEFCSKKITKNGNKKKYVCTKHNSDHIPRKRNKKAIQKVDNLIIKRKKKGKKRKPIKISIGNPFFLCFNNILP